MRIKDLLRGIRRTREEPFGAAAGGLFRVRRRLPTVTVTGGLLEDLSSILEPLAKKELDKVVSRWKEAREAKGYEFTGEQADVLISYYDEAKKAITATYRLLITSQGMEVILRAQKFSELKNRLESVGKGKTKELVMEFTSRDFHMWLELKDSFILRPFLTIGGTERREVISLAQKILGCFARRRNLNRLVDNSLSLLLFPFLLGFLLLNTIFRCLGGVTLTDAFLFGLFLNIPLFLLVVILIRKGFPLVEFNLTEEEMKGLNVPKVLFFLVALGIPAFSIVTRLF